MSVFYGRPEMRKMPKSQKCLELFSGAGGLALGLERAGFHHLALVEQNKNARLTIEKNNSRNYYERNWRLHQIPDARGIDFSQYRDELALVAGGPPCQPFSLGGNHRGRSDSRNLFPEAIRAVRQALPQAFLFENVPALMRPSFNKYVEYIKRSLERPYVVRKSGEKWQEHSRRLDQIRCGVKNYCMSYDVHLVQVQCADYGVAQLRSRMFFVGFRRDLCAEWSPPAPTHSQEALLRALYISKEYWIRHGIRPRKTPDKLRDAVELLAKRPQNESAKPWLTVRDVLLRLGKPSRIEDRVSANANQHVYVAGARAYSGHTGCSLDWLAKTIKAGVHGVPGGENTVRLDSGRLRYFTVREAACLQGFPADYLFEGSWAEVMRQIGNAVPVPVASRIAESIIAALEGASTAQCSDKHMENS